MSHNPAIAMFPREEYIKRRAKLKQQIGKGILLFLGNEESSINFKDNTYPFRQDSTFIYFFGLQSPGLTAVMDLEKDQEIIFGDDRSMDEIVFMGANIPMAESADKAGIHHVLDSAMLKDYIGKAMARGIPIHYLPPYRPEHTIKLASLLDIPPSDVPKKVSVELIKGVVMLRAIKSPAEIVEIEKAVDSTVDMQYRAMAMAEVGLREADLYGAVQGIAMAKGNNTSFPTIMTVNGQILHNDFRGNRLKKGDMVLCDCGAESHLGYSGDLTRTFPVEKKFSSQQREIYDIVYAAYQTAVSQLKPGALFMDIHLKACTKLTEGLIGLGIMKGNPEEAVMAGAHTVLFQCGLGHMMGLDVHDMENLGEEYVGYTEDLKQRKDFGFKSLRLGRWLEAGMVLTIEPGIYFIPELIQLRKSQGMFMDFINYEKLEAYSDFGGVRIEDDFAITEDGRQLLGNRLPTSSQEVENFRESMLRL